MSETSGDLMETVELCRSAGQLRELAYALTRLGAKERDSGNRAVALEHYAEAVAIYRAELDALRLAHSVRHLGDIHQEMGRVDLAEPCYAEALEIYRGDARTPALDLANAIRGFALLKEHAGAREQARILWEEARDLYAEVGVEPGVEESSQRMALLER